MISKTSLYRAFVETMFKSIFGSSAGYAQANISFSYKHKVMGLRNIDVFLKDDNMHLIAQ